MNNPDFSRLGKENWPALENYVRTVVQSLRGDAHVLGWNIMNEPMTDFEHVTRAERDLIWEFVRHCCRFVKETDPRHPITVGDAVAEYIPRTSDLVDFVSLHSYSPRESWFRPDIDLTRRSGAEQGKPMVITECGSPEGGQPYPLVIRVAGEERVGFYLWEIMIGKIMFRDSQGVIYRDQLDRKRACCHWKVGRNTGERSRGLRARVLHVGPSGTKRLSVSIPASMAPCCAGK